MNEHLVNIGEVIVNGIVFDPKNGERLHHMDPNELLGNIPKLFDLLDQQDVDYLLVGGIAMLAYVDGRNTQDIDLILAKEDLDKLPGIRLEDDNPEFARGWLGDLRVDFLFTKNQLFDYVRRNQHEAKEFVGRTIPCATPVGLVMLKLFALPSLYRQGQFGKVRIYQNDIAELMNSFKPDMNLVFNELAKHLHESDVAELREIVAKIETELADSKGRFTGE